MTTTNMISWADFTAEMTDIISSGNRDDLSTWHREQLTELFDKVHQNDIGRFLNMYYADVEATELLEDELNFVAERTDLKVNMKITFSD